MSQLEYVDVIDRLTDYYNISSQAAWDMINQYDLTPAQAANLIPQYQQLVYYGDNGVAEIADGVYKYYNNAGDVIGYNQVSTVPTGGTQLVPINSNVQSGTAEYAVKTQFAGNSVIDQAGKVKTSGGIPKYSGGSLVGNILATEVSPTAIIPAISVATSIGKGIDSLIYNSNPAFWDSLGLSTLNPETWNTITSDMGDTGLKGLAKTAINMLLHLDSSTGKTQAYLSQDAYNYLAYALAHAGMFDVGGSATADIHYDGSNTTLNPKLVQPVQYFTTGKFYGGVGNAWTTEFLEVSNCILAAVQESAGLVRIYAISTNGTYGGTCIYRTGRGNPPSSWSTYTFTITSSSYTDIKVNGTTYRCYVSQITAYDSRLSGNYATYPINAVNSASNNINIEGELSYIYNYGTIQGGLAGVTDQSGATVPTGIDSSSTQQQVADAISQQYPDLYNNRLERDVVQDDGTVKKIIYYPVPMPNDTTDTELEDDTHINVDQPIEIILPEGETLELEDGTIIEGDGTTAIEIPPGEYDLPNGTIITNNYIYNITNIQGGSQAETEVTDNSTDELKNLIISLLTQIKVQTLGDTDTQEIEDTTEPNPPDTGDGNTPPVVVPTGSASRLWSVYNPTLAEINSFGAWLWSNNFVDQLLKLFNDPMQAIIGLHKTFIPPSTGGAQNIQVGYLDSGVSALTVPTQYSSVDCGSVQLPEYFGNVFDYSPYTRVYIYLPFIGFKELDVSQVMRSTIGVKYHGDAYTGTGLAEVSVTRDGSGGVLYTYGCECAVRYPLSQGSYMGFATAVAGLAVGVASGNIAPALLGFAHGSSKPSVEHSGAFSGNSGAMGIKKPYIVVMRPQPAMPRQYQHYSGVPSSSLVTVGEASGLIRVRECHVEQISSATREEKIMIERALREGVIVS